MVAGFRVSLYTLVVAGVAGTCWRWRSKRADNASRATSHSNFYILRIVGPSHKVLAKTTATGNDVSPRGSGGIRIVECSEFAVVRMVAVPGRCERPLPLGVQLRADRFVLAVIPNRKRITKKISVRFARRPFHHNMYGSTLLNSKGRAPWTFLICFLTPSGLSLFLQATPQPQRWSTPLSQTGLKRVLLAPQRHHRERHEGIAALGPSRADRPSHPPGRRH